MKIVDFLLVLENELTRIPFGILRDTRALAVVHKRRNGLLDPLPVPLDQHVENDDEQNRRHYPNHRRTFHGHLLSDL
jgi:hypothetical protein